MYIGLAVFSSGDFVLILGVYEKFGKYVTRVNDSAVKMQKAAVYLRRVCKLLKLREHRHLHEELVQELIRLPLRRRRNHHTNTWKSEESYFLCLKI